MQRALMHAEAAHAQTGVHMHAGAEAMSAAAKPMRHGTLEGHVLPGVMFIVWGVRTLLRRQNAGTPAVVAHVS